MKKILIIAVACLAFVSCKKDRVCSCKVVTTTTTPSGSHDVVTDFDVTLKNTSLKNASNACIHTKQTDTDGNTTISTDTNCSLK